MNPTATLEARLSALEREVAEIKRRIPPVDANNWFDKVAGSFENDPEFEEVVRLGRELRESDMLNDGGEES